MKTNFPDRISRLNEIFGYERVAKYLSPADEIDVLKWANSGTLVNVKIDYSCLLNKFPEFNKQWLEEGIGEMFKCGNEEENIKAIYERLNKELGGKFF